MALCITVLRKWEGPVWEPGAASVVELLTAEAEADPNLGEGAWPAWTDRLATRLAGRNWPCLTSICIPRGRNRDQVGDLSRVTPV